MDAVDAIVRALYAERYGRSLWWRHVDVRPNDIAAQLDRLHNLAASTEPTISTPQGSELLTCIKETQDADIHRHVHRAVTGRYARRPEPPTPPSTGAVDDALGGSDLLKDNGHSNQQEAQ